MYSLCVAFFIYLNWTELAAAPTIQAQENQIDALSKGLYEFGIALHQVNGLSSTMNAL